MTCLDAPFSASRLDVFKATGQHFPHNIGTLEALATSNRHLQHHKDDFDEERHLYKAYSEYKKSHNDKVPDHVLGHDANGVRQGRKPHPQHQAL
jgi:hypothetical protein